MLKKIVFLGTGGTIAGRAAHAADNVGYKAAQVGVAQLMQDIPGLLHLGAGYDLVSEQVCQVDSKDMGWSHWRALALRIHDSLVEPEVHAVVVTHGTDTLEETAFFLSQVLQPALLAAKAVVLTCAMRPSSSSSPDGPQNVLDAVAVARLESSHGVLVVCAGTIHCARDVQKVHPYRLDAFDSGDAGPLGYVEEGQVRWVHSIPVTAAWGSHSSGGRLAQVVWPRVEIIMNYVGATGATVRALCASPGVGEQPVRGLVVAGTGNGTIHEDLETALFAVQAKGVRVVRATRCSQGRVVFGATDDPWSPSHGLSPVKARIALALDMLL